MSNFKIFQLPTFSSERGILTVLEKVLPFEVVRIYWIYGADGQTRGGHRHRQTRQALIALNGHISIYMNDGMAQETVELIHPIQCLLVETKDWHTMSFGSGSILLVLSSHLYDQNDYIDKPYE